MDRKYWEETAVLVTGCCGTVGRELLRQLSNIGTHRIVAIDNNESDLFLLSQDYADYANVNLYLTDIRDPSGLRQRMVDVDLVLHAAAYKHVILCEQSPRDAIQTNILGTQNVVQAAQRQGVSRVIFTSSDKAVNPTNVMGTSKLMGERLFTAANAHRRHGDTMFSSTRFGNVLGSRGSVIPLFARQIAAGGPVTLTDIRMTRFIMTKEEAAHLVLSSVDLAHGGEVFVTKMPVMRVEDLAAVMIEELAPIFGYDPRQVRVNNIGVKAGEKLYEELLSDEETRRAVELERFYVILPAFRNVYENIIYEYAGTRSQVVELPFNSHSQQAMTREELRAYLKTNRLLEMQT